MKNKIELKVIDLSTSLTQANAYTLLLQEKEGGRQLSVVIGPVEAQAIAFGLKRFSYFRPFTHDLFISFAEIFSAELKEIFIYKVKEGVFYSYMFFEQDGHMHRLDARTSDAVALALRFDCSIYTTEEILQTKNVQTEEGVFFSTSITAVGTSVLKEALAKAINDENYELASQLRDEIRRRERKETKNNLI